MKFSKSFFARLFWFLVGGVLSIWVNAGLFRLFTHGFGWRDSVAYALSLAIINVLLFLWNYVVGFKSDRHWTDAAWRQAVCLTVSNGLNYALVNAGVRVTELLVARRSLEDVFLELTETAEVPR